MKKYIRVSELATTATKAGRLPVSAATIWRWVREGKFPKPIKLGASVTVWDIEEVDQFVAARTLETN
jgi:predicted DNA-binding transcriptional regulator AlpA